MQHYSYLECPLVVILEFRLIKSMIENSKRYKTLYKSMLNGLYCFFLGIVYGCELDTVTRVLGRVISGLFNFARQYLYWFSREELDGTMFKSFKVELVKG